MFLPDGVYVVRVVWFAPATVVAAQGEKEVAFFEIDVVPQDGTAISQVGAHVEKVVFPVANGFDPERHDLHIAACTGFRERIFVEPAFNLDKAEDKLRIKSRTGGLVVDRGQQLRAGIWVGNALFEAVGHFGEPAVAFGDIFNCDAGWGIAHCLVQGGAHAGSQKFFLLIPCLRRRAGQHAGASGKQGKKAGFHVCHTARWRRRRLVRYPIASSGASFNSMPP